MSVVTTRDQSIDLLTVTEAAELARCSEHTIRRRVRSGELSAVRLGHGRSAIRTPRAALTTWLTPVVEEVTS